MIFLDTFLYWNVIMKNYTLFSSTSWIFLLFCLYLVSRIIMENLFHSITQNLFSRVTQTFRLKKIIIMFFRRKQKDIMLKWRHNVFYACSGLFVIRNWGNYLLLVPFWSFLYALADTVKFLLVFLVTA